MRVGRTSGTLSTPSTWPVERIVLAEGAKGGGAGYFGFMDGVPPAGFEPATHGKRATVAEEAEAMKA
jgi:hypothetical protein